MQSLSVQGPARNLAARKPMVAPHRSYEPRPTGFSAAGGSHCTCGGSCPRCRAKLPLQAKLEANRSGDRLEQEADSAADRVLRMSQPEAASPPRMSTSAGPRLSRASTAGAARDSPAVPPRALAVVRSSGAPLEPSVREFMEPRFGHDLSRVRVHTDAGAGESAAAVQARAYTVGSHIVFASGRYEPHTSAGRRLLAHELAHTLQQSRAGFDTPGHAPMLQAQPDKPPGDDPPPPDFECKIDLVLLARLAAGDKSAALKVLDCCASGIPVVGHGCTSDIVEAACKLMPDVCEKKKKEGKKPVCPAGFRPARSERFSGMCCPEGKGIEQSAECCPPSQMIKNGGISSCCQSPEVPNDDKTACVPKLGPCPADQNAPWMRPGPRVDKFICECPEPRQNKKEGTCCPEGQEGSSGQCVTPQKQPAPPPMPTPAPPKVKIAQSFDIFFVKDYPQTWFDPRASFQVSTTDKGKTKFKELVDWLNAHPDEKVQLEAHASSDRPEKDADYNKRLTDRRVQLIFDELKKQKLDARVADPPGQTPSAGCDPLASGQSSCGDNGAEKPVNEADRKVVARVFSVAGPSSSPSP